MSIPDLVLYLSPIVTLILLVLVYINYKMSRIARKYEDYKSDAFRQSIERQISDLTKELSINKDRFNSINHLILDAQNNYYNFKPNSKNKYDLNKNLDFFSNIGVNPSATIDDTLVFVLTPFNEKYKTQYDTIRDVVTNLGFRCTKGDDSNVSSNILGHIIQQISKSRIVIANISGRNPNVFYELGIAHALGKPVLIVSESLTDIPFDINSSRILAFENEAELSERLVNWLIHTLANSPIPENK